MVTWTWILKSGESMAKNVMLRKLSAGFLCMEVLICFSSCGRQTEQMSVNVTTTEGDTQIDKE